MFGIEFGIWVCGLDVRALVVRMGFAVSTWYMTLLESLGNSIGNFSGFYIKGLKGLLGSGLNEFGLREFGHSEQWGASC